MWELSQLHDVCPGPSWETGVAGSWNPLEPSLLIGASAGSDNPSSSVGSSVRLGLPHSMAASE